MSVCWRIGDDELNMVIKLLDMLTESIGYDYVVLKSEDKDVSEYRCVFGAWGTYRYMDAKTSDGKFIVVSSVDDDGRKITSSEMYWLLARKLYKILDSGETIFVDRLDDRSTPLKIEANTVPKFMMLCVLNGIVQ